MKHHLKLKHLLFILFLVFGIKAMGQDKPESATLQPEKTVVRDAAKCYDLPPVEFNSPEEKEVMIARLEAAIQRRLDMGKTPEELSYHYDLLETWKAATIKNPDSHEE